jgi:hypothetical protein
VEIGPAFLATEPPPKTIAGLALLAFCSGCETIPAQPPPRAQRTQATLAASKDRVWPLLVSQVGLEYPVRAIEKDSGLISTDWVTLPAGFNNMNTTRWTMPRSGFLATWNGLRMNMKIMAVEAEPGRTQVTVNCHYEAFEDNVSKAWLVMDSNGAVENAILTRIEDQLRVAPAPAASPVVAPAAPVARSPREALTELKKLLDEGVITQADYDAKKKAILDRL